MKIKTNILILQTRMSDSEILLIEVLQEFLNGCSKDVGFEVLRHKGSRAEYLTEINSDNGIFSNSDFTDEGFTLFKIDSKKVEWDYYNYIDLNDTIHITSKETYNVGMNRRHEDVDLPSYYIIIVIGRLREGEYMLGAFDRSGETHRDGRGPFAINCHLYFDLFGCSQSGVQIPKRNEEGKILLPIPGGSTKAAK